MFTLLFPLVPVGRPWSFHVFCMNFNHRTMWNHLFSLYLTSFQHSCVLTKFKEHMLGVISTIQHLPLSESLSPVLNNNWQTLVDFSWPLFEFQMKFTHLQTFSSTFINLLTTEVWFHLGQHSCMPSREIWALSQGDGEPKRALNAAGAGRADMAGGIWQTWGDGCGARRGGVRAPTHPSPTLPRMQPPSLLSVGMATSRASP